MRRGGGEIVLLVFLLVCFSLCEVIDFYRLSFIGKSAADMEEGHENCGFKCAC